MRCNAELNLSINLSALTLCLSQLESVVCLLIVRALLVLLLFADLVCVGYLLDGAQKLHHANEHPGAREQPRASLC